MTPPMLISTTRFSRDIGKNTLKVCLPWSVIESRIFIDTELIILRVQARELVRETIYKLITETRARDAAAGDAGEEKPTARSGVAPGSFLHLLIHATNKETGKPFTDLQVSTINSQSLLHRFSRAADLAEI